MSSERSGEGGEGPPPPSPLTGAYLLVVLPQLHSAQHKDRLIHALTKGLLTWDAEDYHVDLDKELQNITSQAPEGEEAKNGERLIQFASENLVTEVLIHPQMNTLVQCMRNCLSSFTRHRHIIHAGYTSSGNGAWIVQDGTFSFSDFADMYSEHEVQRVLRAYEGSVSVDMHCSGEGDWWALKAKDPFSKISRVRLNPPDKMSATTAVKEFLSYLSQYLNPAGLTDILQASDVVGNIRFSHPTLYVFPGGQGDAALFGINGFNMLLDGGFARKSCFWDFTRHLDRLDSVLMTRINNGNLQGLASLLRRKTISTKTENVYPQIGHFFSNIPDRKQILSPDGDKDRDPLLINLIEEGHEMINGLKHLGLKPQPCFRDTSMEPINLYHKVGHGKLDMYVLSPAKDSREVREFLAKWAAVDSKIFCSYSRKGEFNFPLSSKTSICALLVWQPADPEDNITRILFPGSTPQQKIFEGLDRLKSLEFMKHPVCSAKTLSPSSSTVKLSMKAPPQPPIKSNLIEKVAENEKKQIETVKAVKKEVGEVKKTTLPPKPKPKVEKLKEKPKTDLEIKQETAKIDKKPEAVQKQEKDLKKEKPKRIVQKPPEKKTQKPPEKKGESIKSSPTTPKKTVDGEKMDASKPETKSEVKPESKQRAPRPKASPSATPAKSAKEANNRKVVELKSKETTRLQMQKAQVQKKDEVKKVEKPVSRKAAPPAKGPKSPSPIKSTGVKQKLDVKKQVKTDKDITTDSSAVSTPSTADAELIKAKEDAKTKEVNQKEEADLKRKESDDKGKSISKEDDEDILIIEKVEINNEVTGKSDIETKLHLHSAEEERKKSIAIKESEKDEVEMPSETEQAAEEEIQEIIETATEIVSKKLDMQKTDSQDISGKDIGSTDKLNIPKEKEGKSSENDQKIDESQPDEKMSTTVESGATTTAPTLPEDERIPLDEIKEGVEEKHVKEDTKEKEVIPSPRPEQPTSLPHVPAIAGSVFDQRAALLKDIVKTPDEVADLPVHEEVDIEIYEGDRKDELLSLPTTKKEKKEEGTDEFKLFKDNLEKEDKSKDLKEDIVESVDVVSHTTTDHDLVSSSPKSGKLHEPNDKDEKQEGIEEVLLEETTKKITGEIEMRESKLHEEMDKQEGKGELVEPKSPEIKKSDVDEPQNDIPLGSLEVKGSTQKEEKGEELLKDSIDIQKEVEGKAILENSLAEMEKSSKVAENKLSEKEDVIQDDKRTEEPDGKVESTITSEKVEKAVIKEIEKEQQGTVIEPKILSEELKKLEELTGKKESSSPKESSGVVSPAQGSGTISPKHISETASPKQSSGTLSPKSVDGTVSPKEATQQDMGGKTEDIPKKIEETIFKGIDGTCLLKEKEGSISPKLVEEAKEADGASSVNEVKEIMQSSEEAKDDEKILKSTGVTMTPKMPGDRMSDLPADATLPKTTEGPISTIIGDSGSSKLTDDAVSPKELDSTTTVDEIAPLEAVVSTSSPKQNGVISPKAVDGTVSPKSVGGTVSPKELGSNVSSKELTTLETVVDIASPKEAGGAISPKEVDGTNLTEAVNGIISAKIADSDDSPKVGDETVAPKATEVTISPKKADSTMSPKATDGTISPKATDGTISPKATDGTISPKAADETISPKAADGTISPKATDGTISPKATDGTISPKAIDGSISPKATDGTTSPKAVDGTISPKATDGTISPKAVDGTISPKATDGTISPKAADGTISPKAADGTISPKAADGTISPKATDGTISPKATDGTISPKAIDGSISLKATDGTTSPKATDGTISPKATDGTISPKAIDGSISPRATDETISPKATDGTTSPKAVDGTISPKATDGTISPKAADGTISPKATDGTTSPKTADGTISPKGTDGMISPKATDGKISPKATDGTISPKAIDGSISLKATDGTTSPKATDGTISPKATDGTISPKAIDGSISPRATDETISPKATDGMISPKATDGKISPKATDGTISPKAIDGSISLKATDGTTSPKATDGTISPKATDGTISPKAIDGSISPRATDETISPKATDGTISQKATDGTISPKAADGTISPKAAAGTISPKATDGTTSPKATDGTISPKAADGTVSPKATDGTISPKATDGTISPKAIDGSISLKATDGTTSPKATDGTISPKAADGTISPKAADGTDSPKATDGTISPKATDGKISPKATDGTISPKAIDGSISPKATDGTISPKVIDGSISPKAIDGTISPKMVDGTISPKMADETISLKMADETIPPKASDGSISPKTTDGAISLKAVDSSISIKTTDGPISPKATDGTISPKASDGTIPPKATDGTISPKTTDGTSSPKATDSSDSPKAIEGTVSPKTTDGTMSSKTTDDTISPKASDGTISPKASDGTISPKAADGIISPKRADGSISPKVTDGTISPKVTDGTTSPKVADHNVSTKLADETISPKEVDGTVSPKATDPAIPPKATDGSVSPKDADHTISTKVGDETISPEEAGGCKSPKKADGTISPKVTDGTLSPKAADGTISPKMPDGTVSPKVNYDIVPPKSTDATISTKETDGSIVPKTEDSTISQVVAEDTISSKIADGADSPKAGDGTVSQPITSQNLEKEKEEKLIGLKASGTISSTEIVSDSKALGDISATHEQTDIKATTTTCAIAQVSEISSIKSDKDHTSFAAEFQKPEEDTEDSRGVLIKESQDSEERKLKEPKYINGLAKEDQEENERSLSPEKITVSSKEEIHKALLLDETRLKEDIKSEVTDSIRVEEQETVEDIKPLECKEEQTAKEVKEEDKFLAKVEQVEAIIESSKVVSEHSSKEITEITSQKLSDAKTDSEVTVKGSVINGFQQLPDEALSSKQESTAIKGEIEKVNGESDEKSAVSSKTEEQKKDLHLTEELSKEVVPEARQEGLKTLKDEISEDSVRGEKDLVSAKVSETGKDEVEEKETKVPEEQKDKSVETKDTVKEEGKVETTILKEHKAIEEVTKVIEGVSEIIEKSIPLKAEESTPTLLEKTEKEDVAVKELKSLEEREIIQKEEGLTEKEKANLAKEEKELDKQEIGSTDLHGKPKVIEEKLKPSIPEAAKEEKYEIVAKLEKSETTLMTNIENARRDEKVEDEEKKMDQARLSDSGKKSEDVVEEKKETSIDTDEKKEVGVKVKEDEKEVEKDISDGKTASLKGTAESKETEPEKEEIPEGEVVSKTSIEEKSEKTKEVSLGASPEESKEIIDISLKERQKGQEESAEKDSGIFLEKETDAKDDSIKYANEVDIEKDLDKKRDEKIQFDKVSGGETASTTLLCEEKQFDSLTSSITTQKLEVELDGTISTPKEIHDQVDEIVKKGLSSHETTASKEKDLTESPKVVSSKTTHEKKVTKRRSSSEFNILDDYDTEVDSENKDDSSKVMKEKMGIASTLPDSKILDKTVQETLDIAVSGKEMKTSMDVKADVCPQPTIVSSIKSETAHTEEKTESLPSSGLTEVSSTKDKEELKSKEAPPKEIKEEPKPSGVPDPSKVSDSEKDAGKVVLEETFLAQKEDKTLTSEDKTIASEDKTLASEDKPLASEDKTLTSEEKPQKSDGKDILESIDDKKEEVKEERMLSEADTSKASLKPEKSAVEVLVKDATLDSVKSSDQESVEKVKEESVLLSESPEPEMSKAEKGTIDSSVKEGPVSKGPVDESERLLKNKIDKEIKRAKHEMEEFQSSSSIAFEDALVDSIGSSEAKKTIEEINEETTKAMTSSVIGLPSVADSFSSEKGEKDHLNEDLKSKMKDGDQPEKLVEKTGQTSSQTALSTGIGTSTTEVTVPSKEQTKDTTSITNGVSVVQEAMKVESLPKLTGKSLMETSMYEELYEVGFKKMEDEKTDEEELTESKGVQEKDVGIVTVTKKETKAVLDDLKAESKVELGSTSTTLEQFAKEKVAKVEKIVTEKHEIEGVKDVSVVKAKLVSELPLNGAVSKEEIKHSFTSGSENVVNGDGKEPTVMAKTDESKIDLKLGEKIEKTGEIVHEVKDTISHKLDTSSGTKLSDPSVGFTDFSMVKDMTSSFISTEKWTGRAIETPEGKVSPSSELSGAWRESDDDLPASPLSTTSHAQSPTPAMFSSVYGQRFDDEDSEPEVEVPSAPTALPAPSYTSVPPEPARFPPDPRDQPLQMPLTPRPPLPGQSSESKPSPFTGQPSEPKAPSKPLASQPLDPTKPPLAPLKPEAKDPIEKWDKPLGLPPPPGRKEYWSPFKEWGHPLNLPSPAPPPPENDTEDNSGSAKTTPKKVARMNEENNRYASNIIIGKEVNNKTRRSDSPVKKNVRKSGMSHIYVDLSYVPHHGNSHYANVEFFRRVRARYYVFSGTEPSKDVFNALLEAKQTWEDKDLEVTIIPTYDTDTLGYWIAENEETLSKYKIDLSPSASRCTINLQDHDTSCSAYRLEF